MCYPMLSEIWVNFPTCGLAKVALTRMRKHYRCAFRGSVVIHTPTGSEGKQWRIYANLSGSGFSATEFASAIQQFNLHGTRSN